MKLFRNLTLTLILILGTIFTAHAVFPDSFWIVKQISERLTFIYGGIEGGTELVTLESDGRMRIGAGEVDLHYGSILELKSDDKSLLIPRVEVVADIATAEEGMIVYENKDKCFKLYQQSNWTACLGVASSIEISAGAPANGQEGDAYYDTLINRLFVHDGQQFQEITVDFETLTSSNHNCTRHELREPNLQVQCPANKKLVSLFYESRTFTDGEDRHLIPEVSGIECCQLTFGTYWWDTSAWSTCTGDAQTRTTTCKDSNGATVSDALCVGSQKPEETQTCGSSNPTGDDCFGGIDADGNVCRCGYAEKVEASTHVGVYGPAGNVLGYPDATSGANGANQVAEFDNEGNAPGSVTVKLENPVVNGPSNDLILHLWDFNPHEAFEVLVSQNGTNYVGLGDQQVQHSGVSTGGVTRMGFDIASSSLSEVNYVKIVNANVDMTTNTEGPDIDAFETRNCKITKPVDSCPIPQGGLTRNGGFESGNQGFYSEYTFQP